MGPPYEIWNYQNKEELYFDNMSTEIVKNRPYRQYLALRLMNGKVA